MSRTLSDDDVQAIALKLVDVLTARLSAPRPASELPPQRAPEPPQLKRQKLAYSLAELSGELRVSKVTLYRLVEGGLLKPLPYLRTKIFAHAEVEKFLRGHGGESLRGER